MRIATPSIALILAIFVSAQPASGDLLIVEDTPLDWWWPYQFSVNEERLARSPGWDPMEGQAIPISPRKAVKLARVHLGKYVEDLKRYELKGAALKTALVTIKKGENAERRWYWVVSFENHAVGAIAGVPLTSEILVLMDGWSPKLKKLEGEEAALVIKDWRKGQQGEEANAEDMPE